MMIRIICLVLLLIAQFASCIAATFACLEGNTVECVVWLNFVIVLSIRFEQEI